MSESERIESQQEARLPLVDTVETLGLLVGPALIVGFGVALLSGLDELMAGIMVGGMFGALLARLRGSLYAVQTDEGIKRKLRSPPDKTIWTRVAEVEYDEKYDRVLAIVCLLVSVGAFVAIPLTDAGGQLAIQLVVISFGGFVCTLLALGTLQL